MVRVTLQTPTAAASAGGVGRFFELFKARSIRNVVFPGCPMTAGSTGPLMTGGRGGLPTSAGI